MKTILINILWLISGAGFLYYPRILLSGVTAFGLQAKKTMSLRKRIASVTTPSILLTIFFPLTYILSLKMSRESFDERLIVESWLWMIPALLFSVAIVLAFRKKRAG